MKIEFKVRIFCYKINSLFLSEEHNFVVALGNNFKLKRN